MHVNIELHILQKTKLQLKQMHMSIKLHSCSYFSYSMGSDYVLQYRYVNVCMQELCCPLESIWPIKVENLNARTTSELKGVLFSCLP